MKVEVEMVTITCCAKGCGIVFAVPDWWSLKRREDHSDWYCPNGHEQHFPAKSKAEKLEWQLKEAEARNRYWQGQAEHQERRARAAKGQVTKIRNRVGRGVCPCCNRTFQNLAQHMKHQHPEYATEVPE